MMPAHRTKPIHCVVPDCDHRADRPGTARGYCKLHYTRRQRYGMCEAELFLCERPATSHIGLCDIHTPTGVLR